MSLKYHARRKLNAWLARANLRLDSLTKERAELQRLESLSSSGHFDRPVFPVPPCVRDSRPAEVLDLVGSYSADFAQFCEGGSSTTAFRFDNEYFPSPDAEVLYAIVRDRRPPLVVEVGSGHSTRLIRQAAIDEGYDCEIRCIDPVPRVEVAQWASIVERRPVEHIAPDRVAAGLGRDCVLFIDSSHRVLTGGDVTHLYLNVLPQLQPGVLVHIHDVFLPYEYPRPWVIEQRWGWNEQYLVQAMLGFGNRFEVLWAGHYVQRTWPDFAAHFRHTQPRTGSSLWLRVAER